MEEIVVTTQTNEQTEMIKLDNMKTEYDNTHNQHKKRNSECCRLIENHNELPPHLITPNLDSKTKRPYNNAEKCLKKNCSKTNDARK